MVALAAFLLWSMGLGMAASKGLVMGMENIYQKIRSFKDLEVYRSSFEASFIVFKQILPKIPEIEKYGLTSQLRRSSMAIPRLIAEGYAKKHQKSGFQKYIDDALAETNETIVTLEQLKDFYKVEPKLCDDLIIKYDRIARQLFNLAKAWDKFSKRRILSQTQNQTSRQN
jgi:four helix bundle protein